MFGLEMRCIGRPKSGSKSGKGEKTEPCLSIRSHPVVRAFPLFFVEKMLRKEGQRYVVRGLCVLGMRLANRKGRR